MRLSQSIKFSGQMQFTKRNRFPTKMIECSRFKKSQRLLVAGQATCQWVKKKKKTGMVFSVVTKVSSWIDSNLSTFFGDTSRQQSAGCSFFVDIFLLAFDFNSFVGSFALAAQTYHHFFSAPTCKQLGNRCGWRGLQTCNYRHFQEEDDFLIGTYFKLYLHFVGSSSLNSELN